MHRSLVISLPAGRTDTLINQLKPLACLVGLSVQRGSSIKPAGDIVPLHVLNKGIDEALRRIENTCRGTTYSIATAEQASLIDPQHDSLVEDDIDEAIWEEMETGLRHQARVTGNYVALMTLGGAMAAVGLVSEPMPQVIASGFEPIAKIPLGLVLRNVHTVRRGLKSAVMGYGALILAAGCTFALLRWLGATSIDEFSQNQATEMMSHPSAKDIIVSACGTLSGAIIIASYRRSIIAGTLMAMVIISAAAMIGAAVACGQWNLALEGAERFGLDILLIIVSCWLVFAFKQQLLHKRKSIV